MIILKQKDFDELLQAMDGEQKIFLAGCSECATACKVGGEEELDKMEQRLTEAGKTVTGKHVFDTACLSGAVRDGVKEHAGEIEDADAILVMACGTGVQSIGDRLETKQVHPGAESLFVGETKALGRYEEKCSLCNDCLLEMTDGICPVTRCSKGLLNGPCGGYSEDGKFPASSPRTITATTITHGPTAGRSRSGPRRRNRKRNPHEQPAQRPGRRPVRRHR